MIRRNPHPRLGDLARLAFEGEGALPDKAASYAGYGRYALLNLFRLLGYGPGDRILLPAYICDVVLLPFAELGIEPVYYGITDDFRVEWDSVRVLPSTRAIITVNYFGFSSDFPAIQSFAERNGLVWINDNAHGFASCHGDTPLEQFGDVSVTSFRKVIPSLNGARIMFNSQRCAALQPEFERLSGEGMHEPRIRCIVGALLRNLGISLRRIPDFSDISGFTDNNMRRYRIDRLSLRLLALSDEARIRARRRALFLAIEAFLDGSAFSCVKVIPNLLREGNSPLVFPLVAAGRDAWLNILRRSRQAGIDIHTWPSLPCTVVEENRYQAVDQWNRFLFLPLHQDIDAADYLPLLNRVLDAV